MPWPSMWLSCSVVFNIFWHWIEWYRMELREVNRLQWEAKRYAAVHGSPRTDLNGSFLPVIILNQTIACAEAAGASCCGDVETL